VARLLGGHLVASTQGRGGDSRLGRIKSESEPPNLATEMNAHRAVDRAPNPLSPVRIPETPTAKTPLTQDPFYYLLGKAQGKSLRGRTQSRWGAVVSRPVSRATQRPSGREPITNPTNPNRTPSRWGELGRYWSLGAIPWYVGKVQGIFVYSGPSNATTAGIPTSFRSVGDEFPKARNREFFRRIREVPGIRSDPR
jgi:hypothetical protein